MTKLKLAKRIAAIVVYGHIGLFIYGLIVMLLSGYDRLDTLQMILMGSPLLAVVGIAAFRFMANLPAVDQSGPTDLSWVVMCTIVSSAFLVALLATYSVAMFRTSLQPSVLKIITGAIETVLGAYLGVIQETLFPKSTA